MTEPPRDRAAARTDIETAPTRAYAELLKPRRFSPGHRRAGSAPAGDAASGRDQVRGVSGQVKAPVAHRLDDADATGQSSIVSVRGTSSMKRVKLGPRRIWPA